MDASAVYLIEALEYCDAMVDLPISDMFFESDDVTKEQMKVNETASKGAIASIKKAIESLIKLIKDTINNFVDFMKNKFMSKKEKEEYKEIKTEIHSNPELAAQPIEIEDFRKYEEAYDKACKELDAEMNKPEPDPTKIDKIVGMLGDQVNALKGVGSTVGKRAAVIVPLKTAVEIADRNVICAKSLSAAMNAEVINLEEARKVLGDKEVAKYKKKIDKYAKNGIFHRAKVRILRRKQATLKSVLVSQMNTIMSFTNHNANKFRADGKKKPIVTKGSILKGAAQNPKFAMDIVGGPKGAMEVQKTLKPITDITDEIERTQKRMKREAKRNKKDLNDFRSFIGFKSKKSNSDDLV